jgi:hypothetical protein
MIIELSSHIDRGTLVAIEGVQIPFKIKRVFYIYDVPERYSRGHHALKTCHQFLIALKGEITVHIHDGRERYQCRLDRPTQGLYLQPMIWRYLFFSPGAICLVLASEPYDPDGYYHSFDDFLEAKNESPLPESTPGSLTQG